MEIQLQFLITTESLLVSADRSRDQERGCQRLG